MSELVFDISANRLKRERQEQANEELQGAEEVGETVAELTSCIHHHMGLATALESPVITAGAQSLLQLYFLLVRQVRFSMTPRP